MPVIVGNRELAELRASLLDWKSGIDWTTVQFTPILSQDVNVGF